MVDGSEQSSKAMVFRRLFIHFFFLGVGLILILLVWISVLLNIFSSLSLVTGPGVFCSYNEGEKIWLTTMPKSQSCVRGRFHSLLGRQAEADSAWLQFLKHLLDIPILLGVTLAAYKVR